MPILPTRLANWRSDRFRLSRSSLIRSPKVVPSMSEYSRFWWRGRPFLPTYAKPCQGTTHRMVQRHDQTGESAGPMVSVL